MRNMVEMAMVEKLTIRKNHVNGGKKLKPAGDIRDTSCKQRLRRIHICQEIK